VYRACTAEVLKSNPETGALMTAVKPIREIRINPTLPSESVLVATERSLRPRKQEERVPHDSRSHVENCPFCRGNEDKTPPTLLALPDEKDCQVRVVSNLYPVLGTDNVLSDYSFGLQQALEGYGHHEVIIDHSRHGIRIHEMSEQHLALVLQTYQRRMDELYSADQRIKYVLVFKNFGRAAGASISHTHSQLIAMPVIPENVYNEVEHSRRYYHKHRQCIFCSLIDEALTFEATIYSPESGEVRRKIGIGQYVVERGKRFIAIKPFASRYDWEVHILPLAHQSNYLEASAEDMADLARVLRRTMARLDKVLGGAQYNYYFHTAPRCEMFADCNPGYHWHLEICPRTSIPAGFELGSGLFVTTISPEDAAARLREAL
jgi:UDPglucose--hexose-1-phosphate uridylyltransferase